MIDAMTIRQFLMRRLSKTIAAVIAFLLDSSALVTSGPHLFALRFAAAVVMAAVIAAAVWSLFRIPCPNYKEMGSLGFRVANGQLKVSSTCCPYCRISGDAKVSAMPKVRNAQAVCGASSTAYANPLDHNGCLMPPITPCAGQIHRLRPRARQGLHLNDHSKNLICGFVLHVAQCSHESGRHT
jgi:hypothetical protein